jgi:N-acetylglucosaminyldiphosphoundecaprenol N-acetyl-beta-D-mannosaminyltransferase
MIVEPPLNVLLGLPFHELTLEETLGFCQEAMHGKAGHYIVTANVDFTTQAYEDPDLKKIVFFADRVVCDGMPLVWLSHLVGKPLPERVAGSDMVPLLLDICGREGHAVYFFGSDIATLIEASELCTKRYPGLRVAGVDSPPIGAVVEWDNDALCEKMRNSGAKLLLVCLGCPKQERWIFAHHDETGIPLSIGVGASLDFITGKQKRAPKWMQKTGLEWLWRMSTDPGRLVARYRKNFVFLFQASWRQYRSLRTSPTSPAPPRAAVGCPGWRDVQRISWAGRLTWKDPSGAPVPAATTLPLFLDASQITGLDSVALGRLALVARVCRAAGQPMFVIAPSPAFREATEAAQMQSLYTVVDDETAAFAILAEMPASDHECRKLDGEVVWVSFSRALDALFYKEMVDTFDATLAENPSLKTLVVDLREVTFIDSRAVGGLIRTWKMMTAKGGQMYLAGASPSVKSIISLLKLDKLLSEWKGDLPA